MKNILSLFFCILIFSCNQNNDPKGPAELLQKDTGNLNPSANFSGCYELLLIADTAYLSLQDDSTGGYKGRMDYRPAELPHHKGTVILRQDSNYLRGWYNSTDFTGKNTNTEKIFKITPRGLTEGTGEMEPRNDSAFFKYPNNLAFEDNFPFIKKQCP